MRATQNYDLLSNVAATGAAFAVEGGNYSFAVSADFTGLGSVTLQRLGPDGTTYLTAYTAFSANGISPVLGLAPGQYRALVSGTIAAGYAKLTRIPVE